MELTINGQKHQVDVAPDTPLLWVIREELGLTGTKYGCWVAQCGACTVLADGRPIRSCVMPVSSVANQAITTIEAFLEIRPDGTALLRSPFVEGGQGIYTAFAQIVGKELDIAPERFSVECAPPGADYLLVNGARFTGGSFSVRSSYEAMRRLGASARHMLLQAAAAKLGVPLDSLATQPGIVVHEASGRTLGYGELAALAAELPPPKQVPLRERKDFRWIGKSVPRLDARDKSTGKVTYNIDLKVDGMLLAAVQHAPHMGGEPEAIANEAEVRAMPGVHSIHRLPGAVAVVAGPARRGVAQGRLEGSRPGDPACHARRFFLRRHARRIGRRSRSGHRRRGNRRCRQGAGAGQPCDRSDLRRALSGPRPVGAAIGDRPLERGRHP